MTTEQIFKTMILLIACVLFAKLVEVLLFFRKQFTCKMCDKAKAYEEMETINYCKNCYNAKY
jgi:hypothetical protein